MAKKEKKKSSFWSDFKKFITRGNVVDMAVGVVIGGAFGKIVTGLVNYIINPFVGIFIKNGSLDSLKTVITEAVYAEDGITVVKPEVAMLWGTWLQTIIDFIIVAFCIFIVIRIITKAQNALHSKELAAKAKADAEAAEKAKADAEAAAAALAAKEAENQELRRSLMAQEGILRNILDEMKKK